MNAYLNKRNERARWRRLMRRFRDPSAYATTAEVADALGSCGFKAPVTLTWSAFARACAIRWLIKRGMKERR